MPNRAERTLGYELHRLEPEVRDRVKERWRESQVDHDWWDFVYEDAVRMASLMGIEIDEKDIQFSGFWSQGDGASFTGRYACKPDAVEAITSECGCSDAKLIRIATELTLLQTTLKLQYGHTFSCAITRTSRSYSHSYTMNVNDWGTEELAAAFDNDYERSTDEFVAPFRQLLRDFADWIYEQLEAEYEHLTSDETIIESINESGLRFSADGEILRAVL